MVDALKAEDAVEVERIVREIGALVCTPSTIPDIYSLSVYRGAIVRRDPMKFWALLDNNIVTQIVSLISGARKTGVPISEETKRICAIMAFLIHARVEANPAVALYERPDHVNNPGKNEQDRLFRIADHLPAQVFADLALSRICAVPVAALEGATHAVDSNRLTQWDLRRVTYSERIEMEPGFKILYANLLKAWLVAHQQGTQEQRFRAFLEWNANELLSDYVGVIFALIYLSEHPIGKMIKHGNSSDRQLILKKIANSTWDMYYLAALEKLHKTAKRSRIWFFCTRDQVLLKIAAHRYAMYLEGMDAFINEFCPGESVAPFTEYMTKINGRPDRENHRTKVLANLDDILDGLVKEVLAC